MKFSIYLNRRVFVMNEFMINLHVSYVAEVGFELAILTRVTDCAVELGLFLLFIENG